MGLTLIRKSEGCEPVEQPKIALVLAGGALTGGGFKVGGLKALNDYLVGRRVTDMDLYVGLSNGAILATSLAAGVSPDEMVRVLLGRSSRIDRLRAADFYSPNFRELLARPANLTWELASWLPGLALDLGARSPGFWDALAPSLRAFLRRPGVGRFQTLAARLAEQVAPRHPLPSPSDHIPSGLFDNAPLERWVRSSLGRIKLPNDFHKFARKTGNRLYISACDLDTAERVVFGADENSDLSISEAVQASGAMPLFYKPARLHGVDYIDGGVRHTATIDIAIEKGADLIICYNPFRPFLNREEGEGDAAEPGGTRLADRGMKAVAHQVFRTLLHSRLQLGIQRYLADERFRGDIVLIEPRERDADAFAANPVAFWRREQQVRHGFESVRSAIERRYGELEEVLARYGMAMDRAAARRRAARAPMAGVWDEPGRERAESARSSQAPLRLVGS